MKSIALICPTRGRPHLATSLTESVMRTAANPGRVAIRFYVDNNDPALEEYRSLYARLGQQHPNVSFVVGPSNGIGFAYNELAMRETSDFIFCMNDDVIFVQPGWDDVLEASAAKYTDGIFCLTVHSRIGGAGGTDDKDFPIVSPRWVEAIGYYNPGMFLVSKNEFWLMDIGERAGRLGHIDDLIVDHMHGTVVESSRDQTWIDLNGTPESHKKGDLDRLVFERSAYLRECAARRLRAVCVDAPVA